MTCYRPPLFRKRQFEPNRIAAKCFLPKALANPDDDPPHIFSRDGCGVIRRRSESYKRRAKFSGVAVIAPGVVAITVSNHCHVKRRLRAMQGPRTKERAWAVIQRIEAAQMIRKGQVLGITRRNLHGQAWVFGALLGLARAQADRLRKLLSVPSRRCNTSLAFYSFPDI
jgi:hypothetical protein